ncbi:HmuY family protein [Deefgea tanakiae]|uniref:HmuY family protein n=1 Tax=Deefgea tanakiae TaxID=2865840 RepID=A0ABX8Z624_9NEIS|nr:HmuY family protein [Deefgea tanakiae]QZA78011.1 HmuY family protein [Deefgea tanakiae]
MKQLFIALGSAALLSACGGGGSLGGATTTPTPTTAPTAAPTPAPVAPTAQVWNAKLPAAGSSICYDFDLSQQADCASANWDLKLASASRGVSLWSNGGESGAGKGGVFGSPFDYTWEALKKWKNGAIDPVSGAVIPETLYLKDTANSVFTGTNGIQSSAFEYGVGGDNDHKLYPNFRVFLISTDNTAVSNTGTATAPVYALQMTGYYGGASGTVSANPSFRWVDRSVAGAPVRTATVDASKAWVYYNLNTAQAVAANDTWHIAFNRYNVKLNSGTSGAGKVGGFTAKTPAGFYGTDGKAIASKFTENNILASTLPDLTATDLATPGSASAWKKDSITSKLNPAAQGTYPAKLDYGWYNYYSTAEGTIVAHSQVANPNRGTLLRSAEGNSFARLRLKEIGYATPGDIRSQQTWQFEIEVLPNSK